jgi:hypothetical protein
MPFAPKRLKKKTDCNKTCPPSTKLNTVTCECIKIPGVPKPGPPLLKGKKGVIVKSKKKK